MMHPASAPPHATRALEDAAAGPVVRRSHEPRFSALPGRGRRSTEAEDEPAELPRPRRGHRVTGRPSPRRARRARGPERHREHGLARHAGMSIILAVIIIVVVVVVPVLVFVFVLVGCHGGKIAQFP